MPKMGFLSRFGRNGPTELFRSHSLIGLIFIPSAFCERVKKRSHLTSTKDSIMRTIDALNILSITQEEVTLQDLKKAYRKSCKAYHPDVNPAGEETMQAVNEAYETLLKLSFPIVLDSSEERKNYGESLNNALNSIIILNDIKIEICGAWVWVSGNTKPHKETFKSSDFLWSRNKGMWYFRPESQKKRFFRGSSSIDEIRTKYGSQTVRSRPAYALSARQ